ncbi:MAG TPA: zinc ribbon domain-containing protein [Chloroflexota bacterium]|jgi:hypothetical protein|nr:zinc ribbon domain-containing protein [Chloroflexota bacterium]
MDDILFPAQPLTICHHCGQQQPDDNVYCSRCGVPRAALRIEAGRYALPLWQLGLFQVLSFTLYTVLWASRCYRFANAAWAAKDNPKRRSPWGRSLLLLVPIISYWAYYRMAAEVREASQIDRGPGPGVLTLVLFVNALYGAGLIVAERTTGAMLAWYGLFLFVPFLFATLPLQHQINRVCERAAPGVTTRRPLGWRGMLGILGGVVLWGALVVRIVAVNRESSGVAVLQFGHDYNKAARAIIFPATTFTTRDTIAWAAFLNGRLGTTQLLRTFDRQTNGALQRVVVGDGALNNPNIKIFYEIHPVSYLLQAGVTQAPTCCATGETAR